jgi:hypothetical protein
MYFRYPPGNENSIPLADRLEKNLSVYAYFTQQITIAITLRRDSSSCWFSSSSYISTQEKMMHSYMTIFFSH